jgi:hypothetical protein
LGENSPNLVTLFQTEEKIQSKGHCCILRLFLVETVAFLVAA